MNGRVVLFNRAAERIYGKGAGDVVGGDVRVLYPEGTAKKIMKMIRAGGGRIEGLKVDIVDAVGAVVPVSFSGALIFEGKTPVGSVGIFTDLREKMQMEQRLQAAQPRARLLQIEGMNHILKLRSGTVAEQMASYADPSLPLPPQLVPGIAEFVKGLPVAVRKD